VHFSLTLYRVSDKSKFLLQEFLIHIFAPGIAVYFSVVLAVSVDFERSFWDICGSGFCASLENYGSFGQFVRHFL
jgi:hypothetical protein